MLRLVAWFGLLVGVGATASFRECIADRLHHLEEKGWCDIPQDFSLAGGQNWAKYARCLCACLLRDGLVEGWPHIDRLASTFEVDPSVQRMLLARYELQEAWSSHWDRWYVICNVFRSSRESTQVARDIAAYVGKSAQHAVSLLAMRRIFKHPGTWKKLFAEAKSARFILKSARQLPAAAVGIIDKVANSCHGDGVRSLFGPGRVWLFGTQHPFSSWLDHARSLARAWASKAPEIASTLIKEGNTAEHIEEMYERDDVPGGPYVTKFTQGDLCEYGAAAGLTSGFSLFEYTSVGPGPPGCVFHLPLCNISGTAKQGAFT